MSDIKYTFLLPAYKASFFEEALVSIKNQSLKNFKVLVSDDCSPESLEPIFQRVVGNDPRFSFRRNKENMGSKSLISHWNLLIDMCDTDYLIMASDDDVYDSCFLEEMDKLVTKYPQVDLFRSNVRKITAQGKQSCEDTQVNEYNTLTDFLLLMYDGTLLHCIANFIFKTETLKANGKFMDLPLAWFSDDATIMICAENGVCNTKDTLFSFRESGINISNTPLSQENNAVKKIHATMQFYDWFCHYYEKHYTGLFASDQEKWKNIRSYIRNRVINLTVPFSKKLQFSEYRKFYHWFDRHQYFKERNRFIFICVWLKAMIRKRF